jgi:hypothetical protein
MHPSAIGNTSWGPSLIAWGAGVVEFVEFFEFVAFVAFVEFVMP